MSNQYIFKKATQKDLDNFFAFFKKATKKYFPEYSLKVRNYFIEYEYSLNAFKGQVKQNRLDIYLSQFNQETIGYLVTCELTGGVGLANWLAVSKQHERKGVASKLLQEWEKASKKNGLHKLHLWTDERNIGFYKKRGFSFVGKIPKNFYGADDYLFYKSIQKPEEKNFLKK